MAAVDAAKAQLTAGKAQINAILGRMANLSEGSVLLPILAETLKPTLNELTDQNGKKLNLGDLLYDKNGNVTPETVKATQTAVNSYFAGMEKQINAGTAQYESGKKSWRTAANSWIPINPSWRKPKSS